MSKLKRFLPLLILFVLVSCSDKSDISPFTYKYSMESIESFKVEFQLNPDSTFKISEFNYFFDNYEGKKKPKYVEGKLNKNDFEKVKQLVKNSEIDKMRDSYGFEDPDKERNIIYMIEIVQDGNTKYVSINANSDNKFDKDFNQLIEFTGNLISDKLSEL